MRHQYHLQESPCGDCLVHFCCETCALCQEHRELKSRGYDMYIEAPSSVFLVRSAGSFLCTFSAARLNKEKGVWSGRSKIYTRNAEKRALGVRLVKDYAWPDLLAIE
ncbi:hypothetical protein Sjap_024683 [Stephania japonica]|uniref:Uncharacterized protein n=1 Tax=Stephania japonica TaxID=461633 RepID=A0AAP0EDU7_9MAGN